jgi:hypothetical protein
MSCYMTVLWFKNSTLQNYISEVMFWTTFLQVDRIYRVRRNTIYSNRLQLLYQRVNCSVLCIRKHFLSLCPLIMTYCLEFYTEIYTVNMRSIAINSLNQLKKVGLISSHRKCCILLWRGIKSKATKRKNKIYL